MVPPFTQEFGIHPCSSPHLYSPHPILFTSPSPLHSHGLCLWPGLPSLAWTTTITEIQLVSLFSPVQPPHGFHSEIFPNPNPTIPFPCLKSEVPPSSSWNPQHFSMTYKSPQDPSSLNCVSSGCSTQVPRSAYLQCLLRELFKNTDFQAPVQRYWYVCGETGLRKSAFL